MQTSGKIGTREDLKEMRILNRIACWTEDGIEYEGDQRHVEICMRELGLKEESRELVIPCDKTAGKLEEDEEYLDHYLIY